MCSKCCSCFYRAWNIALDNISCIQCKIAYTPTSNTARLACLKAQLEKWTTRKTTYEKALKDLGCPGFVATTPTETKSK